MTLVTGFPLPPLRRSFLVRPIEAAQPRSQVEKRSGTQRHERNRCRRHPGHASPPPAPALQRRAQPDPGAASPRPERRVGAPGIPSAPLGGAARAPHSQGADSPARGAKAGAQAEESPAPRRRLLQPWAPGRPRPVASPAGAKAEHGSARAAGAGRGGAGAPSRTLATFAAERSLLGAPAPPSWSLQ